MEKPDQFLIACDEETSWKALYINGKYWTSDETVPIGEIVHLAGGNPVVLSYMHVRVDKMDEGGWPVFEADLVKV